MDPWPNHTPAFQEAALPIQKNLIKHLRKNNLLDEEMKTESDDTLLAHLVSICLDHTSTPAIQSSESGGEPKLKKDSTKPEQTSFRIGMSAQALGDAFITEIVADEQNKQEPEQTDRTERLRHELTKSRKLQTETLRRLRNETIDHSKTMAKLKNARLKSIEADRDIVRETLHVLLGKEKAPDIKWTINIGYASSKDALRILEDLANLVPTDEGESDRERLVVLGARARRQSLPGCPYYSIQSPHDYIRTTKRLLYNIKYSTHRNTVQLTGDLSSTSLALTVFLQMLRARLYEPDTITWRPKAEHVITLCIHDGDITNEDLTAWRIRDIMGPIALKITDSKSRHDYGVRMNALHSITHERHPPQVMYLPQVSCTNTVQRPKRKNKPSPPKLEHGNKSRPVTPPAKRTFY